MAYCHTGKYYNNVSPKKFIMIKVLKHDHDGMKTIFFFQMSPIIWATSITIHIPADTSSDQYDQLIVKNGKGGGGGRYVSVNMLIPPTYLQIMHVTSIRPVRPRFVHPNHCIHDTNYILVDLPTSAVVCYSLY